MDKQIYDAISGLNKRMDYLDKIHPNITYTSGGIATSILNALPLALITSAIAVVVVYTINKNKN